ncbi:MAG: hypothetical protein IJB96_07405 [Lachnospira sp.]|nr:hypothetical protein [Lachnospira sp.]
MYGYVVINKPELKIREFDEYRSYYCGLCRALGERYGVGGKISISYDMTFLVLLLNGLYEPAVKHEKRRCMLHPVVSHEERRSEVTDYVADMNVLMTYYKCVDDWVDERKLTRKVYADTLKKRVSKIIEAYPKKASVIAEELNNLAEFERSGENNMDTVSRCFGNIMSELLAMKCDEWEETLRELGFCLGKFIYILDAYDDLDGDIKKGRYNMLKSHMDNPHFDELIEGILNDVMSRCARCFERLPIIQDAEIIRNIIYSGVWTRFEIVKARKLKKKTN